jgi:hypothetical protein
MIPQLKGKIKMLSIVIRTLRMPTATEKIAKSNFYRSGKYTGIHSKLVIISSIADSISTQRLMLKLDL